MDASPTKFKARYFTLATDGADFLRFAKLRRAIFVEQEGWQLAVEHGLETDQFDHFWANYCLLTHGDEPIAGFRAIRSDRPYLLDTVFPHLAPDLGFPSSPAVWEITRFGVVKGAPAQSGMLLYGLMFEFAQRVEAAQLIALVDPFHERLLRRMRVETARFRDPMTVGHTITGHPIRAVAGRIAITAQATQLQSLFQPLLKKVQIHDNRDVQRPLRVSA